MRLCHKALLANSARAALFRAVLAVFAVLARIAGIVAVTSGERGIRNKTDHERQRKRRHPDALADHMNLRGIVESVTTQAPSRKNQIWYPLIHIVFD